MNRNHRNQALLATTSLLASLAALSVSSTSEAALVNEWKFDETTGTVAAPAAGTVSGRLGTSAGFASGLFNNGLRTSPLAGAYDLNAFVEFPSPVGKFGAGAFTVMFWYKTGFAQAGAISDVLGNRRDAGHGNFFSLRVKGDGSLTAEVDQDANGTLYTALNSGTVKVNDNKWHHVAVTRDVSSFRLYIDGAEVASRLNVPANITGAYPFRVGRSLPNCCANVVTSAGLVDDLQIHDTALAPQVIDTVFENAGTSVVSGLAQKFAPELRFDQAASTFPMSAQDYYAQIVATGLWTTDHPIYENTDISPILSGAVPTYYQVTAVGIQTRINYWWFYGHQSACDAFGDGTHNGDWEHVMVTLSQDNSEIAAVTYYQHAGWYTRLAARDGYEISGATHPIVYVSKTAHGSFHDQGGSGTCLYYEDWRNYGNGKIMSTWQNLVGLARDNEPWMAADRVGGFSWGYDGISTHPTQKAPSLSMDACEGFNALGTDGCAKSQCKVGDDDDGVECWVDCKPGYTDMGVTCTNWSTLQTYTQSAYGYDYTLPTSDLGLLIQVH